MTLTQKTAAKREHHLNRAHQLGQEAEQLEAFAEARQFIRNPGEDHPNYASIRTAYLRGVVALTRAQRLRAEIQAHLIIVTNLTDYTFPTDLASDRWRNQISELAYEAKQYALSDRQIKSRLDSHYHEKAA